VADDTHEINPPPDELRTRAFVVREAAALVFVAAWLLLFAGELLTGRYTLPFWYDCVAVAVLGYALGMNLGELVAKPPSKRAVAKRAVASLYEG